MFSEFPAVTRPWIAYAAEKDCELQFVDERETHDLTETPIQSIDERISVVAVSYVQFATGTRVDIPRLREATRKVGALLMVDVTQAAGALPIDAKGWDADVVVCSGYKWLGGHGGVGLAVMSPRFLDQVPPAPGWMGAPDPFDFEATRLPLAGDARRYTQSTMSYVSLKGAHHRHLRTACVGPGCGRGPRRIIGQFTGEWTGRFGLEAVSWHRRQGGLAAHHLAEPSGRRRRCHRSGPARPEHCLRQPKQPDPYLVGPFQR